MKSEPTIHIHTSTLEVLFTPADFAALNQRDLSDTFCVVFDVLRATSTIATALANGATAIIPVAEIAEALALRQQDSGLLLAGERGGFRIMAELTGSISFDLGNSPLEFTPERVSGRRIAATTTNGTRALRACAPACTVVTGSFLNLRAIAQLIDAQRPAHLLLVCSGTHDQAAYEDVLAAGALCESVWPAYSTGAIADSAVMARHLFLLAQADLPAAFAQSRNGRRLLALPELRADVAYCTQRDILEVVPELGKDGWVRKPPADQPQ
jgi:2-phosphosulfolactate phosphatase